MELIIHPTESNNEIASAFGKPDPKPQHTVYYAQFTDESYRIDKGLGKTAERKYKTHIVAIAYDPENDNRVTSRQVYCDERISTNLGELVPLHSLTPEQTERFFSTLCGRCERFVNRYYDSDNGFPDTIEENSVESQS